MSCASTVVYDGYLWRCSMTTTLPHTNRITDLPVEYADNGQALLTWGTSRQAASDDTLRRTDLRAVRAAPVPAGIRSVARAGDVVIAARDGGALLRGPLGQTGAVAGLLAVAVLVATAATFAFTAQVQRAIPAQSILTSPAPAEGATP